MIKHIAQIDSPSFKWDGILVCSCGWRRPFRLSMSPAEQFMEHIKDEERRQKEIDDRGLMTL